VEKNRYAVIGLKGEGRTTDLKRRTSRKYSSTGKIQVGKKKNKSSHGLIAIAKGPSQESSQRLKNKSQPPGGRTCKPETKGDRCEEKSKNDEKKKKGDLLSRKASDRKRRRNRRKGKCEEILSKQPQNRLKKVLGKNRLELRE